MNKIISKIKPLSFLIAFLNKGQERSVKAKKNILGRFAIKGLDIVLSLMFVPLTLNYVDPARYGIWLTVSSVIGWLAFLDIGLTNGLRNKLAEALAKDDTSLAQTYVSTAYGILGAIFGFAWLVFLLANPYLDWASLLGLSPDYNDDVKALALIVCTYVCMRFVLQIVNAVLNADQHPAQESLILLLGRLFSFFIILALVYTTQGSLVKLGLALCAAPIAVFIAANIFYFRGKYAKLRPRFSKINFEHSKDLLNLGVIFFFIQIAAVIQFQTANIIISREFGAVDVTNYNIVHKYFGVVQMAMIIFVSPFWSASTEAFIKEDYRWIKKSMSYYNLLVIGLTGVSFVMLIFSQPVFDLWLGKDVLDIEFQLTLWGFLMIIVNIFGSAFVNFLNGISALRIQFVASLISPLIFLGSAYLLIRYFDAGVEALFMASIIANFNGWIIAPFQYFQIIHRGKRGLWVR